MFTIRLIIVHLVILIIVIIILRIVIAIIIVLIVITFLLLFLPLIPFYLLLFQISGRWASVRGTYVIIIVAICVFYVQISRPLPHNT